MISQHISRRHFLQVALAGSAGLAFGCGGEGPGTLSRDPFTLGVASGDPMADRVMLWTRLAQEPLDPTGRGGMPSGFVPVVWEVAEDERFRSIVRSGTTLARPEWGHSVHVDVAGLQPGRWYWYRFLTTGFESPAGRTRTAPAPGAAPSSLRFASASCQDFRDGFYTSYENMVQEDLDLVVFLGDYIYEDGGTGVRSHVGPTIDSLAGYRNRYAQYRGGDPDNPEPHLAEAHRLFPWVVTWDDHEVQNNYAGLISEDPEAFPREAFRRLRAQAYQAWWEHMPVRVPPPNSASLGIFRELAFGSLMRMFVLDTRQHRSDQICGDAPSPVGGLNDAARCEAFPPADDSMLGRDQERWLYDRLRRSGAIWNSLGQQTVFSPTPFGTLRNFDQWDGYPNARRRLVDVLRERAVRNPVVLTGDIHASGAAGVPGNLDSFREVFDPVGTEFVATGISSSGLGPDLADTARTVLEGLPHIRFFEAVSRGYVRHEVTPESWRADFRLVDTVEQRSSPIRNEASFVVQDGNPDPQPV